MTEDVQLLLTEEYIAYTAKIADIFAKKKIKQEEVKKIYDNYKQELEVLNTEAAKAQEEWEEWKATQVKSV